MLHIRMLFLGDLLLQVKDVIHQVLAYYGGKLLKVRRPGLRVAMADMPEFLFGAKRSHCGPLRN